MPGPILPGIFKYALSSPFILQPAGLFGSIATLETHWLSPFSEDTCQCLVLTYALNRSIHPFFHDSQIFQDMAVRILAGWYLSFICDLLSCTHPL
jgi:hypothetical protein